MLIKIYNTITKKNEIFKPIKNNEVKIYVCGPTVYDLSHIGHARSNVFFDVIVKYLRNVGFKVNYVRNFTDIDDKIIERSKIKKIEWYKLSQIYIDKFQDDMKFLKVNSVDCEPLVSDNVEAIIEIIQKLIDKDSAYIAKNGVYFSVNSFNKYGILSGRDKDFLNKKSRLDINTSKKKDLDFVLWKNVKNGEPFWTSPWGNGRPGWHIECSAMIKKTLGQPIDIHGGGEDLIFPHHENEIAQSESAYGKCLAKYWIHNGLVNINNKKMSKSLNNWKSINDLSKLYHHEVLRFFLLSSHYRNPINFSEKSLESFKKAIKKGYKVIDKVLNFIKQEDLTNSSKTGILWNKFCHAMNDDFNTAKSIGYIFDYLKKINIFFDNFSKTTKFSNFEHINYIVIDLLHISDILGIFNTLPKDYLCLKKKKVSTKKNHGKIKQLLFERNEARKNKDWEKADSIRKLLKDMNIKIEDKADGTSWKNI